MFSKLRLFLELIRFSHTVFAMPFAMLGAVMAWTTPSPLSEATSFRWLDLVGIVLCMVTARSAAMAFNRLADCQIDAANPRTASRHLPAGTLSLLGVSLFATFCSMAFIVSTLLFLPNVLPSFLSMPVLLVLMGYSFTKRFTAGAHFWLGASLMLAPISAWIAIRGEVLMSDPMDIAPAVLLGTAVLFWVAGFDIIYACQDVEFDREQGLKSVPARAGVEMALRVAAVSHIVAVALLAIVPLAFGWGYGPETRLGVIYWTAVAGVAILLVYEHAIVRPDDLTRVNIAFFNVNAIIGFGIFIAGTIDLLW